ncbi:hypothetical protein PUMCH_000422 [Australozyma saopauloensis]|uniref:Uncharacterized protein n=1 Tax=Australozyma saopauloensis TaxID=291208 RepID=A0AAX4H3S0_9ASCO|nr:hypothetical protein PUMCH_000422 [[Candida] saopauloensis]
MNGGVEIVQRAERLSLDGENKGQHSSSEESQLDHKSERNLSVDGHPNGETPFKSTARSFGVRKAELMTAQYKSGWLKALFYFSTFLCAYCYGLDGTIRYTFQTYATNSYSQHSLFTTVGVIRSVVAAASQPAYARLSDQFGRLELFIVSIIFYAVGTVIESQAYDVQRFAGGAVLYQIGYSGVMLLLEVALSDMSQLNWRLFASFVPALPFIINTWVSGDVAQSLLTSHSWNYAIGIFAFIFPLACVPLLGCFIHMRIAAGRTPEWKLICEEEKAEKKGKNVFVDLFWKLDIVGILLIVCVFGFILVPFTLAGNKTTIFVSAKETWKKAYVIAPLVVGFCLIPALIFWEARFAKFPVIPFPLLKDRGVWSALAIACLINFIWYMPNDFIYTVLVVGMNASIKAATRISSLYSFVSVITGPILGLVIVRVRRTKYFIVAGCAFWFIAMGILLHFRGSNDGLEYKKFQDGVIGGLCLFGFGAGFFTYTTQLSIQTCTNHEYMSIVLSLYLASYNIGSAFGVAVSGAVWTQLMPAEIVKQMSALGVDTSLAGTAYQAPFTFIITHPWGSPGRIAVALAYAHIQRKLCIVGICLCVPLLCMTIFLRNHKLTNAQSLDEEHHGEGITGSKAANKDIIVVNNFDKDPIFDFFRGLFKRK